MVQKRFNLHLGTDNFRENLARTGNSHASHAPKYVRQYYTADTVRAVLRYLAIDYVTLRLRIPTWVQDILDEDCGLNRTEI
eukprot:scaffold348347_cov71-Attheya_sp.AAC.2